MRNFLRLSLFGLMACLTLALAQRPAAAAEQRFALVIGNSQYKTGTLATSANDAGSGPPEQNQTPARPLLAIQQTIALASRRAEVNGRLAAGYTSEARKEAMKAWIWGTRSGSPCFREDALGFCPPALRRVFRPASEPRSRGAFFKTQIVGN